MNGGANGGVLGASVILSGVRHSIFPRVTRAERTLGVIRYRKIFLFNGNNSQDIAYGGLLYLSYPSTAGDRFYIAAGTQTDIETDITTTPPSWTGCGKLASGITAGATSITLAMESNDFVFPAGSVLHISSNFMTSQAAASGVNPGASVTYSGSVWIAAVHDGDTMYPNGIWLGGGIVATENGTGHEEWVSVASESPYSYSGNNVTINLSQPVVDSYLTTNTWASGCVGGTDIVAYTDDYNKVSAGGTYNNGSYPVIAYNNGSVEDTITFTFTGTGAFSASGALVGSLGNSTVSSAFSPVNPATSTPYFSVPIGFFTGTWVAGNTLSFKLHPSAQSVWLKEVVPAGTLQDANNVFGIGYYWE